MYVEKIKYQVEENGEWLVGYLVGNYYNMSSAILLDVNCQEVKEEVLNYEIKGEKYLSYKDDFKYIAKVWVNDVNGWQECKIIHSYRDRVVVVTKSGLQLNRAFKATENAVADGCVYFKREDEE